MVLPWAGKSAGESNRSNASKLRTMAFMICKSPLFRVFGGVSLASIWGRSEKRYQLFGFVKRNFRTVNTCAIVELHRSVCVQHCDTRPVRQFHTNFTIATTQLCSRMGLSPASREADHNMHTARRSDDAIFLAFKLRSEN
jgi:hypothetical protein